MMVPLVPVTVIVYVPVAVDEPTFRVRVELPAPVMDEGLKLAVTPLGIPAAAKLIAESKPPVTVDEIVDVPLLPCTTETEAGEAEMAKLGEEEVSARALTSPDPFGLPQPVTRSYPTVAG